MRYAPYPAAGASKDSRGKLAAWQTLLRLLQLYSLGAPSAVDPELANDLAVITAQAFEGAEAQLLGGPANKNALVFLRRTIPSADRVLPSALPSAHPLSDRKI